MASLAPEVAPFGITTTVVNPGFFRTELLTEQSTNYAARSIGDYDERKAQPLLVGIAPESSRGTWRSRPVREMAGPPAPLA